VHGLLRTYHRLTNHFGRTQWNSYVTRLMWNLVLVYLETVLVSMQDGCIVCAKRTIVCAKLLRDVGLVESHFDPFGDSVSVGVR
jgi:hypothetical protein